MPKVCIFENVMGLLHKKNKKYVDKIINQLNDIGYSVGVEQLCAMDFGVPQCLFFLTLFKFSFDSFIFICSFIYVTE
jgi:hypothetical protein